MLADTPIGSRLIVIDRAVYADRMEGFWLGANIGNWTGRITEMDKIGGEGIHGNFYTREDWGKPDLPSIWGEGKPSDISPVIDFVLLAPGEVWGSDDDTDIEYMYQEYLFQNGLTKLSGEDVRQAWITHIYDEQYPTPYGQADGVFENYLWVSNQRAHELMLQGVTPPETSRPDLNPHWEMIDAQLTTEIFGLFAPAHPSLALELAKMPIQTTARGEAALAAEFYVVMHALALSPSLKKMKRKDALFSMAEQARALLPEGSYTAGMFDFVKADYDRGIQWEEARDRLYERYQIQQADGYDMTSRNLYCNGCFAAGINFGASLISLFYGEGDFKKTVKIGTLAGWDSDNPTATWAGLLGFMLGKVELEKIFGRQLSSEYYIHRTRKGFGNNGFDNFSAMAKKSVSIVDKIVEQKLNGSVDIIRNAWVFKIP
ncbi:ADP-ribosylglycohydrolase family protein [Candidatus Micropelagos thuwalensis]|uniref:ADP-ribosylglycohydrolase family protein n=1 Tax=Candidatus Micropelagius thuwalensis TaxID=1397666 RepID=UPI0004BA0F04|nr:ADP-ribosylglycohydrolase family protein [Candidatus Micropelagos thuwalensis]